MDKHQQIEALKKIAENTLKVQGERRIKPGDIVEDHKNGELGIYLGVKPEGDPEKYIKKQVVQYTDLPILYIILTISMNHADGKGITRIRYTDQKYVTKVMDPEYKNFDRLSDIKDHCENQCFIECSKECSLYRWKMML